MSREVESKDTRRRGFAARCIAGTAGIVRRHWTQAAILLGAFALIVGASRTLQEAYRPAPGLEWNAAYENNARQLDGMRGELEAMRLADLERTERQTAEVMEALERMNGQAAVSTETLSRLLSAPADGEHREKMRALREKIETLEAENADLRKRAAERLTALEKQTADLVQGQAPDPSDTETLRRLRQLSAEMRALRALATGGNGNGSKVVRTNVAVCPIEAGPIRDELTLPGDVEAIEDIHLAALNDGAVEWLGAREGDYVKKGQELARINTSQLIQNVRSAEAAEKLAEANYNRMKRLRARDVSSQGDLDVALSEYRQAQATLAIARQNLDDAHLRSPIAGVLDSLDPDIGEFVNRGQTVARLVDLSTVTLNLSVPEKDISFFRTGQSARVRLPEPLSGIESGHIRRIGVVADPQSRTFVVEVAVANPRRVFLPGMISRVTLVRRHREEAVVLPLFAVIQTQDGPVAFVEKDGKAERRLLQTGVRQGMSVEILDGIEPGDRVVVLGQRSLTDGAPVRVVHTYDKPPTMDQYSADAARAAQAAAAR